MKEIFTPWCRCLQAFKFKAAQYASRICSGQCKPPSRRFRFNCFPSAAVVNIKLSSGGTDMDACRTAGGKNVEHGFRSAKCAFRQLSSLNPHSRINNLSRDLFTTRALIKLALVVSCCTAHRDIFSSLNPTESQTKRVPTASIELSDNPASPIDRDFSLAIPNSHSIIAASSTLTNSSPHPFRPILPPSARCSKQDFRSSRNIIPM
mmetsp:Transcript_10955/g.17858  ORF Transcript_10955/g.17858 Transcript_10955/m.17858 type:complete len:206 (+) Transcript_10955:1304-1921(+)